MISNKTQIINTLSKLLEQKNLAHIRAVVRNIKKDVEKLSKDEDGAHNISFNKKTIKIKSKYLFGELDQILDTRTIERTKYYIQRLIRALSEIKTGKINDLNLHRWKEYDDILTDSLWVLEKRDTSGAHSGGYWGNFIPQIPNQLLRRYTKSGEWVLDAFLGSGTTLIESRRLGRNGVGVELLRKVATSAAKTIKQKYDSSPTRTEIIIGDSSNLNFKSELNKRKIRSVQFLITAPVTLNLATTSGAEKSGQWYAVYALAGATDTIFSLKAMPVIRVASQDSQVITLRNNANGANIGYGFTLTNWRGPAS